MGIAELSLENETLARRALPVSTTPRSQEVLSLQGGDGAGGGRGKVVKQLGGLKGVLLFTVFCMVVN